ncbi:MAG: small subunit ribosomal protein [Chloroflexi bacterium]|jgi:ribosomal protein S1|nr:small subunit ribosomal protein [Chloroflexota bacterium]
METETLAPENVDIHDVNQIKRKMHFTGTVVKTTLAGAVVDIGIGIPGVVHISQIREEPVNRVEDVVQVGQTVDVWVRRVFPKKDRIELTMVKPLELEWRDIDKDLVVKGKVVRLEKFGAFVEIGAERPGLVHISEMAHDYVKTPSEVVKEGDEVEVKVLSVNRRKKQIKLSMKALEEKPVKVAKEALKEPAPQKPAQPAEEVVKEEPIPTAMEMAMREAMERSKVVVKDTSGKDKRKQNASQQDDMEEIVNRTLQHKVRTGK